MLELLQQSCLVESEWITFIISFFVSLWGGVVTYVLDREKVRHKVRVSTSSLHAHLVIASFTGTVVAILCFDLEFSRLTLLVITAISSTTGINAIKKLQAKILALLNDTPPFK